MNKTVTLDVRMWAHPGIGRYIRELTAAMTGQNAAMLFVFLGKPEHRTAILSQNRPGLRFVPTSSEIYTLSEQFEIPLKARGATLLHVPHFNIPVLFSGPLVVTIHDLIYLHDPKFSRSRLGLTYVTWLLKKVQKKAAAILTVSEATKKELLEHFPKLSPKKVFVTYEAASPIFRKIEAAEKLETIKRKFALERPYVLFVGSLKVHKNVETLIRAMANLQTRGLPHELLLVGRRDAKNKELLVEIGRHTFVRTLGEVPDAELVGIYSAAQVLVLPSFKEGFGLPVLEAMACGTPVIASNRSSLPEIVGEAGLLFDPERIDALTELLYNVLNDLELRKKLSEKGIERSKAFSWQRTAAQTRRVYEQVLAA